jgi:orotate phosphoribosyltransferase
MPMDQGQIKALTRSLFEADCLKKGEFKLKNGQKSNYYIEFRESTFDPNLFKMIVNIIASKIRDLHPQTSDLVLVGVPYGVVPIAGAVAYELGCKYAPLRKEEKSHGRQSDLSRLKGSKFILIEDVMTSGSSIREALEKLTDQNVTDVVVIANREAGGEEMLSKQYPNIRVHSILRAADWVV